MADVQGAQAFPEHSSDQCEAPALPWWELLASLKQGGSVSKSSGELLALLEQGIAAVATDTQWNTSGVPQLLERARDMAKRGSLESAKLYAVNCLEFQLAAQRYKAGAAKARSGGSSGGASGSCSTSSDITSTDVGQQQHALGATGLAALACPAQVALESQNSDPDTPSSMSTAPSLQQGSGSGDESTFMVPEPPSKRRRLVPTQSSPRQQEHAHSPAPQLPAVDTRISAGTQEWAGVLGLVAEDGGRSSDLCHASLQLPKHIARDMPRALHFTHLVQRRGVMLGNYQVVRTSIKKANMRQMSRLRSMAQHELVAVAALERLHVIAVPYQDNNGELKLVTFVLSS